MPLHVRPDLSCAFLSPQALLAAIGRGITDYVSNAGGAAMRMSLALLLLVASMFMTLYFRPFIDTSDESIDGDSKHRNVTVSAGSALLGGRQSCLKRRTLCGKCKVKATEPQEEICTQQGVTKDNRPQVFPAAVATKTKHGSQLHRRVGNAALLSHTREWSEKLEDAHKMRTSAPRYAIWIERHLLTRPAVRAFVQMPQRLRPSILEGLALMVCSFNLIVGLATNTIVTKDNSQAKDFALALSVLAAAQYFVNLLLFCVVVAVIAIDDLHARRVVSIDREASFEDRKFVQFFYLLSKNGCSAAFLVHNVAAVETESAMTAAFVDSFTLARVLHDETKSGCRK